MAQDRVGLDHVFPLDNGKMIVEVGYGKSAVHESISLTARINRNEEWY